MNEVLIFKLLLSLSNMNRQTSVQENPPSWCFFSGLYIFLGEFCRVLLSFEIHIYKLIKLSPHVKGVLPREVDQEAKVPTTLVSRSFVGGCRSGASLVLSICPFRWTDPEHNWKPSQHACSFRGYLRDNHRTNVLSTVPPLFASRACDTVETGLI